MRYGFALLALALGGVAGAVLIGGAGLVLLWPASSFGAVGVAYCGLGPGVFGKRPDGTLRGGSMLALLPYLGLTWAVWHLWRFTRGEPSQAELRPGLRIGRRLLPGEYPPDIALVVDLTCEFPASCPPGSETAYRCLPILDGHVPRFEDLLDLLDRIDREEGDVYLHCANGHGRTALVAAALLLRWGRAGDVDEALGVVRELRSGARLSPSQRALLVRFRAGSGGDA